MGWEAKLPAKPMSEDWDPGAQSCHCHRRRPRSRTDRCPPPQCIAVRCRLGIGRPFGLAGVQVLSQSRLSGSDTLAAAGPRRSHRRDHAPTRKLVEWNESESTRSEEQANARQTLLARREQTPMAPHAHHLAASAGTRLHGNQELGRFATFHPPKERVASLLLGASDVPTREGLHE